MRSQTQTILLQQLLTAQTVGVDEELNVDGMKLTIETKEQLEHLRVPCQDCDLKEKLVCTQAACWKFVDVHLSSYISDHS